MVAQAQEKGDVAAGINLGLGFGDSYTNYGIGAKLQYNFADPIRAEASFTYFPKKDYLSLWDLSLNLHYLIPIADKLTFYPLAGVGLLNAKSHISSALSNLGYQGYGDYIDDTSSSKVAFNVGLGLDYKLTDNIIANIEGKYKIAKDLNRTLISIGIAYKF
ncbi:hypothetical protein AGMMS49574_26550 [Bacteroidia bacterium]|nr:hypothetical protein AGMMS49574_26550 [Bacteroidia bacterium]